MTYKIDILLQKIHDHLVAHTVCHPLLAKKRAAERALKLKETQAAVVAETSKKTRARPETAQGRTKLLSAHRPASAMARMNQSSVPQLSENLRRTFAEHDGRMSALSTCSASPKINMRDANFVHVMPVEIQSKTRRAPGVGNHMLRGILDTSKSVTEPTSDFEIGRPGLAKMGASVQPKSAASNFEPPRISAATSAELSCTMDARLEAMICWAEGVSDPTAADAKLSDWFGKWLASYELEQSAFRSTQLYGDIKMCETLNSSSLQRLGTPNRFRTAVVCDMFQRIMPIFGRYKGLMTHIRHEMMVSIYPDMNASDVNVFDMVPFFAGNAALIQEVQDLKKERDRLLQEMSEEQETLIDLQRKVREYREEIQSVKIEAAWSRAKQNQEDVFLLSQKNGGDERQELLAQNKKIKSDMQTETLLRQAAQDRVREMQNDIDMLKIRIQTAEQEWKDSCKTVDSLRKELSIAQARSSTTRSGGPHAGGKSASDLTVVDWVNKVLGAPSENPFLKDISYDLSDCQIYLELLSLISDGEEKLRTDIQLAKMKQNSAEVAVSTAAIFENQLNCKLFAGEELLDTQPFIHNTILLEMLCTYNDMQTANQLPDGAIQPESQVRAAIRRSTIAGILRDVYALSLKCKEQAGMLEEYIGEHVSDEDLEQHAESKLTLQDLELILARADSVCPEDERNVMANQCMQILHHKRNLLHGTFHYYCKMAERDVDGESVEANKQTYLSGMETMDHREFEALLNASKLQLPALHQACGKAFQGAIENLRDSSESHIDLGMGFVHFEECLVRLAVELSPQWAQGASSAVKYVSEALETILSHIDQNCERLQHVEFGTSVRAENMMDVWGRYEAELRQGFKQYCSSDNQSSMTLHDFILFLKEIKVSTSRLTVPSMVDIFSCVQEEASEENSADTMDFQEFTEALAAWCAAPSTHPFLSLISPCPPSLLLYPRKPHVFGCMFIACQNSMCLSFQPPKMALLL